MDNCLSLYSFLCSFSLAAKLLKVSPVHAMFLSLQTLYMYLAVDYILSLTLNTELKVTCHTVFICASDIFKGVHNCDLMELSGF